jgi:ABC-type transport system substrate-binding protein
MNPRNVLSRYLVTPLLLLLAVLLAACASGNAPEVVVRETVPPEIVVATPTPAPADADTAATSDSPPDETPPDDAPGGSAAAALSPDGSFSTPHPVLSDLRVRQAIAHCTDRRELITAVYPFLDEQAQEQLLMDSFLPQGHWALAPDELTTYPFDPEQGQQLLEEAGWMLEEGEVRVNADGTPLNIKLLTTDAEYRVIWTSVLEQQLLNNCGIQLIRTHAPSAYVFGARSGLQVRNFELAAFAWVGEVNPASYTLYACNQIPLPENNWEGQNYLGWCNEDASRAIIAAANALDREQRREHLATFQREFTQDMVSLPLFNNLEALAASPNVRNMRADPTIDSFTANITEWELEDGGDTVVIGVSQEPSSLFFLTEVDLSTFIAGSLLVSRAATSYDYAYQPAEAMAELPTLENGGAVNETVEVSEGDLVWNLDGEAVELEPGLEVWNADGEIIVYDGGSMEMNQLSVTFEFAEGLTWEDGEPVTREDYELLYEIDCHPDSGSISYTFCDSIAEVDFFSDNGYTITYLPGVQWPSYSVQTLGFYANLYTAGGYPAHRVLSDGRTLAEVPAAEWSTLPEITEQPLSYGPYRLVEWQKGQRMVFEVNPHYHGEAPQIENVIIQFFADSNQAVTQLLSGGIDVLGNDTLVGGTELEKVFDAVEEERLTVMPYPSIAWEHLDMNLYIR